MNFDKIKIYLDGPKLKEIQDPLNSNIYGYTFNPTLFKNLGVKDYLDHCRKIQAISDNKPISLEVIGDTYNDMMLQAEKISLIGENVYVKIPISFTNGDTTLEVIKDLAQKKINLNITAIFTMEQVKKILPSIKSNNSIISVFAGRIFDIGIDATQIMKDIARYVHNNSNCKLLWASTRQIYDLILAKKSGCKIITMSLSIYNKKDNFKKKWKSFSLETVKTFYYDAIKSNFKL